MSCSPRARARAILFAAAFTWSVAPRLAHADPPPGQGAGAGASQAAPPRGRGAWGAFRAGAKLAHSVPTAAILDGGWSLATHIDTELVARTWDSPRPWGTIGQYSTRFLYGLSWTVMLGLESLAVVVGSGGKLDWIGEANYRTDWIMPLDLPACTRVGAEGGCGIGIGNFAFLQVKPRRSGWWYEAGGGWFQQRVSNDALRTVGESSWVLTPISVLRELATDPDGDVALKVLAGPGLYFGMHNAHVHPTLRGKEVYDVPWTEMYPLDAGIGPGVRVEAQLVFARHLTVEGDLTFAPFLVGGPYSNVSRDAAPLDFDRQGMSVWRKLGAGIGWQDPQILPFKATVAFFAAELSDRPIDRIGYRGAMLRFDVPLKVPGDD